MISQKINLLPPYTEKVSLKNVKHSNVFKIIFYIYTHVHTHTHSPKHINKGYWSKTAYTTTFKSYN